MANVLRVHVAAAAIAALAVASSPALAQRRDSLAVAAGARVRVILYERPIVRIIGAYVGADSARVLVHDERADILVGAEWKDIEYIEVFRRRLTNHEAFGRGARVGAVAFGSIAIAGVVTAIVWDARGGCANSDAEFCIPATFLAVPLGYLVTVGGTLVGGSLGLLFQDNWRTVWHPR
jgi:hypothetical protein